MNILQELETLKDLDITRLVLEADRQADLNLALPPEVKATLEAINRSYDERLKDLDDSISRLEAAIRVAVLAAGQTVKGVYTAVFNKGRVSWDTKALDGYAAAHPEIAQFKKAGDPSVSIRRG